MRRASSRSLLIFALDAVKAQYSSTMFLLVCSEFFTASNALGCVRCVLRRSSIVKVVARRQSAPGSPQRAARSYSESPTLKTHAGFNLRELQRAGRFLSTRSSAVYDALRASQ